MNGEDLWRINAASSGKGWVVRDGQLLGKGDQRPIINCEWTSQHLNTQIIYNPTVGVLLHHCQPTPPFQSIGLFCKETISFDSYVNPSVVIGLEQHGILNSSHRHANVAVNSSSPGTRWGIKGTEGTSQQCYTGTSATDNPKGFGIFTLSSCSYKAVSFNSIQGLSGTIVLQRIRQSWK